MTERDVESRVRELEANPLFRRLLDAGVIACEPYSGARFAMSRPQGWELRAGSDGLLICWMSLSHKPHVK